MNSMIIVAAGCGSRMGAGKNKLLMEADGKPLIWYTLSHVLTSRLLDEIILVVREEERPAFVSAARSFDTSVTFRLAEGGRTRMESVRHGLEQVSENSRTVLIHDGARPLVDGALIDRVIERLDEEHPAVLTAIPCVDTMKSVRNGRVEKTVPRDTLYRAQTPQGFLTSLFREWMERADQEDGLTDDASLAERMGVPVEIVPGSERYFKVTTREDWNRFMKWLSPANIDFRTGQGYDIHQFAEHRPLILGGVEILPEHGLLGHSDADVLTHAIMDALLGAAGEPDIGHFFPDNDPAYEGASSMKLLDAVMKHIRSLGFEVGNVDATIIAEWPRLSGHREAMKESLARGMGISADRISVKATTKEKLDAIGNKLGIAVLANALLIRRN
jgi:2-C-methyl-D-erythritol 4-phosphate cytidylyltransferase/2-C-methyl-D-erythritol 2,4-cyclodiphosphate synthase